VIRVPQYNDDGSVVRDAQNQVQYQEIPADRFIEQIVRQANDHPLLQIADAQFGASFSQGPDGQIDLNRAAAALRTVAVPAFQAAADAASDGLAADNDQVDRVQAQLGRARALIYAAMPGAAVDAEQTDEQTQAQAQALLRVLPETTGIDPHNRYAIAQGAGLITEAITTLNTLLDNPALTTQEREELEGLREDAIRTLAMMAQTFIQAGSRYRSAYQAIAQLMQTLVGGRGITLENGEGNPPLSLDGRQGLIQAFRTGGRTSITITQALRERYRMHVRVTQATAEEVADAGGGAPGGGHGGHGEHGGEGEGEGDPFGPGG
jgi:hypothetical protein